MCIQAPARGNLHAPVGGLHSRGPAGSRWRAYSWARYNGHFDFLDLPDPEAPLIGDLRWGAFEHPLTPAFWVAQAWMTGKPSANGFQLGRSLEEEVVYCILGGYGISAEVGLAAAKRFAAPFRTCQTSPIDVRACGNC